MLKSLAILLLATSTAYADICNDRPADFLPKGADSYTLSHVEVITTDGGRVDWGSDDYLYFDRKIGVDGYEIWRRNMATGIETCLTCSNAELAADAGNVRGQPAINPTATWMAFQAEHPNHATVSDPQASQPGKGMFNDLWVMELATGKATLLNRVSDGKWFRPKGGTLHPHWSNDGTRIMWGDELDYFIPFCGFLGCWQISMAEFYVLETVPIQPVLENRENFTPAYQWYETHSWSPNDEIFIYTADQYNQFELCTDINYNSIAQLQAGCAPIPLTLSSGNYGEPCYYDEHAQMTPSGDAIVWLNTEEIAQGEIWIMNPDGSNRRRLTGFNIPGTVEYELTGGEYESNVPSDSAWNPNPPVGKAQLAVFVQVDFQFNNNESNLNFIYLLEFDVE